MKKKIENLKTIEYLNKEKKNYCLMNLES